MSHVTKNALKDDLNRTIQATSNAGTSIKNTYNNLVDSLYQVEVAHANTTSGSGVVNLSTVQPANTFLEDVIIICTSGVGFDAASLGARIGTAVGGTQILEPAAASNTCLEPGASEAITAGVGTSIHDKIRTSLAGNATITLKAGSVYTDTERTIHTQVSASAGGFDDNNGEFTVAMRYVQL